MRKSQSSQRLTQGGQSQGTPRSQPPPLASRELQELARAAVRYLLMNDYDKVPIKHTAIVNNVMSKAQNKNTAQVMQLAGKMLKDVSTLFSTNVVFCCFFALLCSGHVYLLFVFAGVWNRAR